MIAYAARTGTRRNNEFLRRNGWRLMLSVSDLRDPLGLPYALDNGAWHYFQMNQDYNPDLFRRACESLGPHADFVVTPDIVCGGLPSLDRSLLWIDFCLQHSQLVLIPVQNGMHPENVAPYLCSSIGIFIGGDSAFKESTLFDWCEIAFKHDAYVHCARVNSQRRLLLCQQAGIDSFDGSGPSRYLKHAQRMDRAHRQSALVWRGNLTERKDLPGGAGSDFRLSPPAVP